MYQGDSIVFNRKQYCFVLFSHSIFINLPLFPSSNWKLEAKMH